MRPFYLFGSVVQALRSFDGVEGIQYGYTYTDILLFGVMADDGEAVRHGAQQSSTEPQAHIQGRQADLATAGRPCLPVPQLPGEWG